MLPMTTPAGKSFNLENSGVKIPFMKTITLCSELSNKNFLTSFISISGLETDGLKLCRRMGAILVYFHSSFFVFGNSSFEKLSIASSLILCKGVLPSPFRLFSNSLNFDIYQSFIFKISFISEFFSTRD